MSERRDNEKWRVKEGVGEGKWCGEEWKGMIR